jgi:hypothetical protein
MPTGSSRELRLALGMRGGVSLAVWIGGACVEIDGLRRAPSLPAAPASNRPFWSRLTSATGYDSVLVDVMAGASAGGLNGVLFAACQVYGVPFDLIRATWLKVGSTEQLVRTPDTERDCEPDLRWLSLFRGDGHMFRSIVDALTSLIDDVDDSQRSREAPRVDLRLSATHVEPILRPVRSPADEQLNERRFGTGFRFRSSDQRWLGTDFPSYAAPQQPGRDEFAGHINRLALAARTTSSYPGAFEAASVRSSRPPSFAAADRPPRADVGADMAGVFADRSVNGPFAVADGGIVDNIPLRRALDAVAAAPAEGPTDRFLIYLHPGAPTAATIPSTGPAPTEERRRSVASVVRAAAGAKVLGEDISGDIAAIDDHNRAIERAVAVRRATFDALTDRGVLTSSAFAARSSYLTQRAGEDTLLVKRLLDDPWGFLGDDPFPSHVGGEQIDESRWRSPLAGFTLSQLDRLDDALYGHMAARLSSWREPTGGLDGTVFSTGALPLMRVTQSLLEWARHVERYEPDVGGTVKRVLYRVLACCEVGIERPRRMAWVALLATSPRDSDDMAAVLSTAIGRLKPLTERTVEEAELLVGALVKGDDGQLVDVLRRCHSVIDEIVPTAWTGTIAADAGPMIVDVRRTVAEQLLVGQAESLRAAHAPPAPQ